MSTQQNELPRPNQYPPSARSIVGRRKLELSKKAIYEITKVGAIKCVKALPQALLITAGVTELGTATTIPLIVYDNNRTIMYM
jgi:multisubunit Na+/H+ antiporter MnhC subunit